MDAWMYLPDPLTMSIKGCERTRVVPKLGHPDAMLTNQRRLPSLREKEQVEDDDDTVPSGAGRAHVEQSRGGPQPCH